MNRGFIVMARGIFEHPSFPPEKFSEREAWWWLIEHAAWKDTRMSVGRTSIEVKRGQCAFALRYLAQKFQWSDSKVRRWLKRRADDAQITVQPTRDATLITICNYNKHQGQQRTDDAQIDTPTDALPDAKKNNKQITNNKREEELWAVADAPRPDAGKVFDEKFWSTYPRREGANPKAPARKLFIAAVKSGADPMVIVAGAGRYSADLSKSNKVGTPLVAQAMTWLRQRRWEDYPHDPPAADAKPRPPDPSLPSHDELKRRYGASNEPSSQEEGSGVRQEGSGARREVAAARPARPPDDPARDGGVECLGTLFRGIPGLLPLGDEAHDRELEGGERGCGDDGTDAMARVVR